MGLPYENTSSGEKATQELQKILSKFGCQSFGIMNDYENKKLVLQFKYRDRQIHMEASISGYAKAWLKEHPWSNRMKKSQIEYERVALDVASIAVHSILRDWVKGQITAVECGILSFEGAFLGQIMLPSGKTVLDHALGTQLLLLDKPA